MRFKILIILTITLIIITSYYYGIVVFAEEDSDIGKTLVTEAGTDISEILKYPNYVVISNNVNVYEEGVYEVIYRNINTNKEVNKKVHVISDKQNAYLYENLIYQEQTEEDRYYVKDVFSYMGNANCMYSYYSSRTGYNNYFIGELNNNKHSNHTVSLYTKGDIVDSFVYNDECLMVGTDMNVMNGDRDIFIYNKRGLTINQTMIEISGYDKPTSIAGNDKYYFVSGITSIQNEYFQGTRKDEDSYIISINKENGKIENVIMLPLNGNDKIEELIYYNNYLYLVQTSSNSSLRLLKLDIFGNIIKEVNLNLQYGYTNLQLKLINDKLYLAYSMYDYETMDYVNIIQEVNQNIELNIVFRKYNSGHHMIDFIIEGDLKFILLNDYKTKLGYEYLIYDIDNELVGSIKSECNDKVVGFGSKNVVVAMSNDNKSIKYYQINSLIKIKEPILELSTEFTNEENSTFVSDYCYLINGERVYHDSKSSLEYDLDLFGDYNFKYHFSSDFEYFTNKCGIVKPFIGAFDNEVYDVGLCIKGNGKLYVNNTLVEGNYIFKETGSYEIKLIGKNDINVIYNITIKDLSIKYKEIINQEMINIDNATSEKPNLPSLNTTFEMNRNLNNHSKNYNFLYLIPVMTFGVAILFIKRVG